MLLSLRLEGEDITRLLCLSAHVQKSLATTDTRKKSIFLFKTKNTLLR